MPIRRPSVNAALSTTWVTFEPLTTGQIDASFHWQAIGGPSDVAKIMKKMPKQLSERTIRALKKTDKLLAQAIEEEMFIFENLRDLDKKSLGSVLRSVDAAQLAVLALEGVEHPGLGSALMRLQQQRRRELQIQRLI